MDDEPQDIGTGMKRVADRSSVDFTKEEKAELRKKLDEFDAMRGYGLIR